MATSSFAVVLEPDEDGGFTVLVPSLPGVVTQGETVDEALENARDAIALTLAGETAPRAITDRAEVFKVDVALS
ncbi:MAG: type II toxin-antitoxin system HicB family antitoxin [Candidatus Eremiobacteraeota bacterium]|nr:type II toxin-antitoxin system HicB family antitoxin [Candidatus Eremiobacteraeota bacterium]